MISSALKSFDISQFERIIYYNYFDNSIKLFSDLYLAKFLIL